MSLEIGLNISAQSAGLSWYKNYHQFLGIVLYNAKQHVGLHIKNGYYEGARFRVKYIKSKDSLYFVDCILINRMWIKKKPVFLFEFLEVE